MVTLHPQLSSAQWEVAPEKGEELELSAESPCELREPEPSPFSSKRTMYETEEVRPRAWGASDVTGHQREFLSPIVLDQRGSEAPPLMGPERQDTGEGRPRTGRSEPRPLTPCVRTSGSSSLKVMRFEWETVTALASAQMVWV